jgi:uncharacterized repeat protein (TIGR04076 family)
MAEQKLNEAEQTAAEDLLNWARAFELVRTTPSRKLLKIISPQDEEQYYSLVSDLSPRLIFHEPVYFIITVHEAKGECRAGHEIGDRWEFNWCTPEGMCGSAYHSMYPVLHGLMMTSGRYWGPAAEKTLVSCPDAGWMTFRIDRFRWTPQEWNDPWE